MFKQLIISALLAAAVGAGFVLPAEAEPHAPPPQTSLISPDAGDSTYDVEQC